MAGNLREDLFSLARGDVPGAAAAPIVIGMFMTIIVYIRRLHDLNFSAWWCFLFLVPIVEIPANLYILFARGTTGPNRYGPDPLAGPQATLLSGGQLGQGNAWANNTEPTPFVNPIHGNVQFVSADPVKRCSDCSELIMAAARICRYCRRTFTSEEIAASLAEAECTYKAIESPKLNIDYYTRGGGYVRGPFSDAELAEMISSGSVTRSHEIAAMSSGMKPRGHDFKPAPSVAVWK